MLREPLRLAVDSPTAQFRRQIYTGPLRLLFSTCLVQEGVAREGRFAEFRRGSASTIVRLTRSGRPMPDQYSILDIQTDLDSVRALSNSLPKANLMREVNT